jgi:hypothetical protein
MKKKLKTIAIVFGLGLAQIVTAQNVSSIIDLEQENFSSRIITKTNSNTLYIFLERYGHKPVLFNFIDEKGHVLFRKSLSKNIIRDRFKLNLDQLADGNYTVVVYDKYMKAKKTFRKETEIIIAKPIIGLIEQSIVAID